MELALITPVMVMVMLGCIDFGRFPSTAIAVRNAAREGAEYARTHDFIPKTEANWRAQITQAVVDEMSGVVGFDAQSLTVNATRSDIGGGRSLVSVEVGYPFRTVVTWDFRGLAVPSKFTVRHQVVMEADFGR